ncbi:hypothetical protein EW146_g8720 [Bondarzewia mesenterica]|uniref:Polysaccharide lyase 14 domain-containing protein n=1 Tax=Bondarzewia mesenterica TaxID=1095465 RepID=A0A4S4LCL1_9AGAM|nr:hypothetical protein EW146_g8720 [Bondarzewia mesenterica]
MYSFNVFLLVLVALFSFANALPLGHGYIRRSCSHNTRASAATSVAPSATSLSTPSSSVRSSSSSKASSSSDSSLKKASASASSSSAQASASHVSTISNKAVAGTTALLSALFPVAQSSASWTTLDGASGALSLSDSTFNPTHVLSSLTHNYVTSPGSGSDAKLSMQAHYPKGSYTFTHSPQGGISFYAPGPNSLDLSTAKEATFGYSVMFEDGFDWNMGGKLPGLSSASCGPIEGGWPAVDALACMESRSRDLDLPIVAWCDQATFIHIGLRYVEAPCSTRTSPIVSFILRVPAASTDSQLLRSLDGGDDDNVAISCSGGRRSDACFSARLMWRTGGAGELYTYLPPYTDSQFAANEKQCSVAPKSECNPTYGASVGRGSTSDWASPKDQNTYFSDFSMAITEKL